MKINAKIDLLFNSDGLHIVIYDDDANVQFVDAQLSPQQTVDALSRLGRTPIASCEVRGLDRVGKVAEHQQFEFQMPARVYNGRKSLAADTVRKLCPDGWEPVTRFGSQNSFFDRDGEVWARTTIWRWVDKPESES